jgi:hypothetical protein
MFVTKRHDGIYLHRSIPDACEFFVCQYYYECYVPCEALNRVDLQKARRESVGTQSSLPYKHFLHLSTGRNYQKLLKR